MINCQGREKVLLQFSFSDNLALQMKKSKIPPELVYSDTNVIGFYLAACPVHKLYRDFTSGVL